MAVAGDHAGRWYLYEMTVYGETWLTPDLYSVALSSNSQRTQIIDLDDTDPDGWDQDQWPAFPVIDSVIYELHVRDFSASDPTCPKEYAGTYMAFTAESNGTSHLAALAQALGQELNVKDMPG